MYKRQVSPYVILPGDQATTEHISTIWENTKEIAYNREYRTVNGTYEGQDMTMTSTGIGCQPAEICLNELKKVGAHTCIKVGCAEEMCIRDRFPPDLNFPDSRAAQLYKEAVHLFA